jgi:hypothetical protein
MVRASAAREPDGLEAALERIKAHAPGRGEPHHPSRSETSGHFIHPEPRGLPLGGGTTVSGAPRSRLVGHAAPC